MATIDTLVVDLVLDVTQLRTQLNELTATVKTRREEFERHGQSLVAVASGLFRAMAPLVGVFLGIRSALDAINFTKHASESVTAFSNLADVIGITTDRLSTWKQAADTFAKDSGDAFANSLANQAMMLQQWVGPRGTGQAPEEAYQVFQRYGLKHPREYLGNIEGLQRDLAAGFERRGATPSERSVALEALGVDRRLQGMYASVKIMDDALNKAKQLGGVTKSQSESMKLIMADIANLGNAVKLLGIAIVDKLAKPIQASLGFILDLIVKARDAWQKSETSKSWSEFFNKYFSYTPDLVEPVPRSERMRPSLPISPLGGGAIAIPPRTGSRPAPAPALPLPQSLMRTQPTQPTPFSDPMSGFPMPAPAPAPSTPAPGSFEERWRGIAGPFGSQSSVSPNIFNLPQMAMDHGRSAAVSTTDNSVRNTTIGGISFYSDTGSNLGHAPGDVSQLMRTQSFAAHADESLE